MDINLYRQNIKPKLQLAKKLDFIRQSIKTQREKMQDIDEQSKMFLQPVIDTLETMPIIRAQKSRPFNDEQVEIFEKTYSLPNPYKITNTFPIAKRVGELIQSIGRQKGNDRSKRRKKEYDIEMNLLRRYKEFITTGSGFEPIYYNSIDELKDRLNLVLGSIQAGNTSPDLKKEANAILHEMYKKDAITNEKLKKFLIHYNIE